jgi:hypothetical protein
MKKFNHNIGYETHPRTVKRFAIMSQSKCVDELKLFFLSFFPLFSTGQRSPHLLFGVV